MFFESDRKQLIVVYKDEMVMNYFRKLIQSNQENTIELVAWDEKVWSSNKKDGEVDNANILFIGDIKDTYKLAPVVDYKFDYRGVKYGWAGKRAIILADSSKLENKSDYNAFLDEFERICHVGKFEKSSEEEMAENLGLFGGNIALGAAAGFLLGGIGIPIAALVGAGFYAISDYYKDKEKVLKQQYLYGISIFFYNSLDEFINV